MVVFTQKKQHKYKVKRLGLYVLQKLFFKKNGYFFLFLGIFNEQRVYHPTEPRVAERQKADRLPVYRGGDAETGFRHSRSYRQNYSSLCILSYNDRVKK